MPNNPAYDLILHDYVKYHVVFLYVGGLFTLLLLLFCGYAGVRFRRVRDWSFEKRAFLIFGVLSAVLGLGMAVVLAANISVVVHPEPGLADAIGPMGHGLSRAWLESGSGHVPAVVQHRIEERLAWQRPKAIICSVLLVAVAALSVWLWRPLLQPSRPPRRGLRLSSAIVSAAAGLVLMLMVIGNTEGSIAPLTLTLIYG